jgi:hypothetical protein
MTDDTTTDSDSSTDSDTTAGADAGIDTDADAGTDTDADAGTDTGEVIREPTDEGFPCGVWVGHYDDDPENDLVEIQNIWCDATVRHVVVPKRNIDAVIDALERRQ